MSQKRLLETSDTEDEQDTGVQHRKAQPHPSLQSTLRADSSFVAQHASVPSQPSQPGSQSASNSLLQESDPDDSDDEVSRSAPRSRKRQPYAKPLLVNPPPPHAIQPPPAPQNIPSQPRVNAPALVLDPNVKPNFPHVQTDVLTSFKLGVESRPGPFEGHDVEIPVAINRYLRDYQRDGARFIYNHYCRNRGGLLCDDMGLGKTVQVISFLAAILHKKGHPSERLGRRTLLREGRLVGTPIVVLIVCPSSVIGNWQRELDTWGYFEVGIFHGAQREETAKRAKNGSLEVVITSFTTCRNQLDMLKEIPWAALIVDEVHVLKGVKSQTTRALKSFDQVTCRYGLTGTAIQNNYKDLWCILDWCNPGSVSSESSFENNVAIPLRLGQAFNATKREVAKARSVAIALRDCVLNKYMIRRTKKLIAHQLPRKEDKVVFCPMTDRQKSVYRNILQSDDFQILIRKGEICDCEIGEERQLTRGECCYTVNSEGVPWRFTLLPCLNILQKVSNHLGLIMPDQNDPRDKQEKDLKLSKIGFGDQADNMKLRWFNKRDPENCGKWKVLEKLLEAWKNLNSKVLLFSHSVKLLNMLSSLMDEQGYYYKRLDGSTPVETRMDIVDSFNNDPKQFVFLISTKAGGVGLNLTSANICVIFDPNWNPAHDLQAQDRAFRIGQTRDVSVYRLVAAGSLEEVVYGRQIYKQQQANIGYEASEERRLFEGVQGDKTRKGELFGIENLLGYYYTRSDMMTKLILEKVDRAESEYLLNNIQIVDAPEGAEDGDGTNHAVNGDEDDANHAQTQGGDHNDEALNENDLRVLDTKLNTDERACQAKLERDTVAAILAGENIGYTHVNTDVLGSSEVEKQITKDAIMAVETGLATQEVAYGLQGFLEESDEEIEENPALRDFKVGDAPADVRQEMFREMAAHFKKQPKEFAEFILGTTREKRQRMLQQFQEQRYGIKLHQ
ncbi:hypothetical protein HDV05_008449 [Chytridiales sp. JEL 0842]|nr:hypothetical protein HDV05_008449 [Chytridiales sp. JEL 0842]